MTSDRDDDLRARFAALRAADARRVPQFDVRPSAYPRGRGWAWTGGAVALAAVLAVSFAWRVGKPGRDIPAPAAPEVMLHVADEMPSDFLLEGEAADIRRDAPVFAVETNDEVPFL